MKITVEYNSGIKYRPLFVDKATWIEKYKIYIVFNDGQNKLIDFESFLDKSLHPDITKYKDIKLFKSFNIVDGNLNWNDYDLIFPVTDLYNNSL